MRPRFFTLVEFVVVVAVLVILFSLLQPAFLRTLQSAKTTQCMNQQREMMIAVHLFSEDNEGSFPDPDDRVGGGRNGWIDDNQWEADKNTPAALKRGSLYPYVQNVDLYRCPEDDRHVVSYQISVLIGGSLNSSFANKRVNDVQNPSWKLMFVEEDTWRVSAWGAWAIHARTSQPGLNLGRWWDDVANWHNGGMNVAYVDGHVENWRWQDPRTIKPEQVSPNGLGTTWHLTHPNSPDTDKTRRAYLGISPKK